MATRVTHPVSQRSCPRTLSPQPNPATHCLTSQTFILNQTLDGKIHDCIPEKLAPREWHHFFAACLESSQTPLDQWQSLNACGTEPGKQFPEHPYSCKASLRFFLNECLSNRIALWLPGACPPGTSPAAPVQSGLIPFDAVCSLNSGGCCVRTLFVHRFKFTHTPRLHSSQISLFCS